MNVLVTGGAGFIGSNLIDRLIELDCKVTAVDNFNDYYPREIKERNLEKAKKYKNFRLTEADIMDYDKLNEIFKVCKPQGVIHLAARAGVRPSIADPVLYSYVNVLGTTNLLKLSADYKVDKFIFGSSSSVYGNSNSVPFSEDDLCQDIVSPYGASKRSAEFFVESFHRSFGLKSVILRFFTVYGKRGRPDMAPAIFAKAILEGGKIEQFGDGSSSRDYTYIDDIVDGVTRALHADLDFAIVNLGNNYPIRLDGFIKLMEKVSGKRARVEIVDKKLGDVERTWAKVVRAKKLLDWEPKVSLEEGLEKYFRWLSTN